jgi:hypothetical protein
MCDCLKLNLGSFCHLMMNDWADSIGGREIMRKGSSSLNARCRISLPTPASDETRLVLIKAALRPRPDALISIRLKRCDASGGVGADSYTLAVGHKEGAHFVIDLVRGTGGKFDRSICRWATRAKAMRPSWPGARAYTPTGERQRDRTACPRAL